MANNMVGDLAALGFVNKQRVSLGGSNSNVGGIGSAADYASVSSLRTALSTANGTYYTTKLLDQLTVNDMIYALRTINGNVSATGSI